MPKGVMTAGRRPHRMLQVPGGLLPAACDPAAIPWHSLRYVVTAASSTLSFSAVSPVFCYCKTKMICRVAGQKVYGIDKTLLVPLVQPSVDIVQGQVSGPDLSLLFLAA